MKFAIVTATYKRRDGQTPFYLRRALDSVFNQTHQDFKVFIIGDAYDDNDEFLNIMEQYPKEKMYYENLPLAREREKYKDNEKALWCSCGLYAINHAIDVALQEGFIYICHLDQDDFWNQDHLKDFDDIINETGADWLCSRGTHHNPANPILPRKQTTQRYIDYVPQSSDVINSSTCINLQTIPIRCRDVFEETGTPYPADADRWERIRPFIIQNKLKSILINNLSCIHGKERGK